MIRLPLIAVIAFGLIESANAQTLRVYDQVCIDQSIAACGPEKHPQLGPTPPYNYPHIHNPAWDERITWQRCNQKDHRTPCIRDVGKAVADANKELLDSYLTRIQKVLDRLEETAVVGTTPLSPAREKDQ